MSCMHIIHMPWAIWQPIRGQNDNQLHSIKSHCQSQQLTINHIHSTTWPLTANNQSHHTIRVTCHLKTNHSTGWHLITTNHSTLHSINSHYQSQHSMTTWPLFSNNQSQNNMISNNQSQHNMNSTNQSQYSIHSTITCIPARKLKKNNVVMVL